MSAKVVYMVFTRVQSLLNQYAMCAYYKQINTLGFDHAHAHPVAQLQEDNSFESGREIKKIIASL